MIENFNQSIAIISEKMEEKKEIASLLDKQILISSGFIERKVNK